MRKLYSIYESKLLYLNKRKFFIPNVFFVFSIIFSGLCMVSCVSEAIEEAIPFVPDFPIGKNVSISIQAPKNSISTYATETGDTHENHIDTLFINILENNMLVEEIKLYGNALQTVSESNDTIVHVTRELDNLSGGTLTAEVFANYTEVKPITSEIPLPDKNDDEKWVMMSGSGTLAFNGIAYHGTIVLVRNVAKLRVRISKHPACMPSNLVIDYSQIKVETLQVPDRTQLFAPPPIITPPGLAYIANYTSRSGNTLRTEKPLAIFDGGQIDSLYLYENYLDNSDYNVYNTTQVKITVPTQEPGMPVKTAEYTYQLYTEGSFQIKRNHIYVLDIQIAGQSLEPFVAIDMLSWNDVNVIGDIHGSFLNLNQSKVYLSPSATKKNPTTIIYHTDNTSVTLDWSKVNPMHRIDTSVGYIQGANGQIQFSWIGTGAPDYSFRDTLNVIAGNIIKSVVLEYNVPKGNFGNWVGTFHRWNQTGERIIKMRNTGEWTATVTQGADFIRLNSEETKDVHWGSSAAALGNTTGFDAGYPVSGNATSLTGNGIIYFRVGLTGTLEHIGAPPRYGIIEVSTVEGIQKIYVRQGEEADYVMHPDNPNPANENRRRPYSVKFSPYNLTDPQRGTGGSMISSHNDVIFGGVLDKRNFTDYPTQSGYFYQWNAGAGSYRKAFHPVHPIQSITGWETTTQDFWDRLLDPCPPGYRHPNDSLRSPLTSEIRQSLFATPHSNTFGPSHPTHTELDNAVWGFYADGFFDRLAVGASPNAIDSTTVSFNASNLAAMSNSSIAYAGLLVYNPYNGASLFLPTPGLRVGSSSGGALANAGALGAYWTSSPNGNNGWAFYLTPTSFYVYNNAHQSNGASVRCVKNDFGLPGSTG